MAIEIDLKIDSTKCKAFLSGMPDKVLQQATARSLNRTILTIREITRADIGSRLKLKSAEITKALEITQRAKPSEEIDMQEARIRVSNKPQSLGGFSPKQTALGVTVNIKGQTKLIRHAFLLKNVIGRGGGGGTSGVFIRKRVLKPGITIRRVGPQHSELPIQKLYTTRVSEVFTDQKGRYVLEGQKQLNKEMNANFKYYYNRYLSS